MKTKFNIPCLALVVLMTAANHGLADQAPQNGKTSAAQIKKEFEAFWTTEKTQAVKPPPTMANVPYGEHEKQVYLFYSMPPAIGKDQKDPTHSSNFGVKLQEKMRATGVECHLMYPGATHLPQPNPVEFLIARLKTEHIKSDANK